MTPDRFLRPGSSVFPLQDDFPAMLRTVTQYLRSLEDPYGLVRTLRDPEVCRRPDGRPWYAVGNSAVVFKVRCAGRTRMLKCYTRPMPHLEILYGRRLLRRELFIYTDHERGEWADVVTGPWYEGPTLGDAVIRAAAAGDRERLLFLAVAFDRLVLAMLRRDWAHGDLKPENIIVTARGLRLVDFDASYLPALAGEPSPELGTAAYQHPARTVRDYDRHLDDFPAALLSTALHALALDPGLYGRTPLTDGLLFVPKEVVDGSSAVWRECLELFSRAGDAVHWRIALLLRSPVLRLAGLEELMDFAVRLAGTLPDGDRASDLTAAYAAAPPELFVRDGWWGFRDGVRIVIPPVYDAGFDFTEGLAAVLTGRRWAFVDTAGREALCMEGFDAVKPFRNGCAVAERNGCRYAVDRRGRVRKLDI